jgi:hypothetical protein
MGRNPPKVHDTIIFFTTPTISWCHLVFKQKDDKECKTQSWISISQAKKDK